MTASSNGMPRRGDATASCARRNTSACSRWSPAAPSLILVPLLLTLYLSLFDEKLILFPPRGTRSPGIPPSCRTSARAVVTSLKLGALSVAGSLLLGIPAGIGLSRHRFAVAASSHAAARAAHHARHRARASRSTGAGGIRRTTRLNSHRLDDGLVLAHVMITTPWVVRLCLASLTNHDRAAEEAAASLGAGPLTVIWRVTLPAMRAGIVAAALFAFVISFENLELALFLPAPASPRCRSQCCNTWSTTSTRWSPPSRWRRSSRWRRCCWCSTASSAWARWCDDRGARLRSTT